jgi:hypothetical protein
VRIESSVPLPSSLFFWPSHFAHALHGLARTNPGIGQASASADDAASAVERYRALQELHAILSDSSSSSTSLSQTEADARVEMLLNHSGDSVLCWQMAYMTTTTTTTTKSQSSSMHHRLQQHQRHPQRGRERERAVDVAVVALLLECLALIWTPSSSSASSKTDRRRVQSMKQAAHATLPILLHYVHDNNNNDDDMRIQKPLVFILRLYAKIRHAPTKSLLIQSGLVVQLRRALEKQQQQTRSRCLSLERKDDDPRHKAARAAAAPSHGNNNNSHQDDDENNWIVPCILGLMKDLLFRAESTEKLYMYEEWHNVVLGNNDDAGASTAPRNYMLSTTLNLLSEADQEDVASAEAIAACLWNWAVCDELVARTGRVTQNPSVWQTLHGLLSMPSNNHHPQRGQQQGHHYEQNEPQTPHLLAAPRHPEEDVEEYNEQQQQYPISPSNHRHDDNVWANVHRNALAALGTIIASCTVTTMTTRRSLNCTSNNNNNNAGAMADVLQQQAPWLVPRLCQILEDRNNKDKDSRRRCIRTLRCLSSCSWGRVILLQQVPPQPANVVVAQNPFLNHPSTQQQQHPPQQNHTPILTLFLRCLQRRDDEVDTRIQAALAIAALLPSCPVTAWMTMGPYIETALVQTIEGDENAATYSDDKLVLTAIQALQVSLEHNPWKRGGSGCFSPQFFESTLRVLCHQLAEPRYHATVASLILQLVHQKKSSSAAGCASGVGGGGGNKNNNSKPLTMLTCPPVAEILSTLLTPLGPDFEASQSEALQAIVALTTTTTTATSITSSNGQMNENNNDDDDAVVAVDNETNYRKNLQTLAANECLLNNLVNLCLIAPTFKEQAKSIILKLIPEL